MHSCTHAHMHTCLHARVSIRTQTSARTHANSRAHTRTAIDEVTMTHARARARAHSHTAIDEVKMIHTHVRARTQTHTAIDEVKMKQSTCVCVRARTCGWCLSARACVCVCACVCVRVCVVHVACAAVDLGLDRPVQQVHRRDLHMCVARARARVRASRARTGLRMRARTHACMPRERSVLLRGDGPVTGWGRKGAAAPQRPRRRAGAERARPRGLETADRKPGLGPALVPARCGPLQHRLGIAGVGLVV
jgi:hypothetical protein